ncbi:hypothetical protein D3C76_1095760 [compost metagenome]
MNQLLDAVGRPLLYPLFQLLAKPGQADSAHVAAAALEAVRGHTELVGGPGTVQLTQALLGVFEKGFQQLQITLLHDLLQVPEHAVIDMHVCHLFTP